MIKLAEIFSDAMLLQRDKEIRLWGTTDTAQTVRVLLDGKEVLSTKIDGAFTMILPPQKAMENVQLELCGDADRIVFQNVDIGELWIAGGQSNMEFLLKYAENAASEISCANDPHLRFYDVGEYSYPGEKEETPKNTCGWDRWMSFNPEDAEYFSAVGFYFAKKLREKYGVPVGIIGCNWGGTSASCWMDERYLQEDKMLQSYLREYEDSLEQIDMATYPNFYREGQRAIFSSPFREINQKIIAGTMTVLDQLRLLPIGMKLLQYTSTGGPYSETRPCGLYHMMLEKIVGMTTRGVLWYQGESDEKKAPLYGQLFSQMVRCWRDAWHEELPFLTVMLAPMGKWMAASGENFPEIRRQQDWARKHIRSVYMVCIMDDGDKKDIHPKNKRIVGERLAALAAGKIYGETGECESPDAENFRLQEGMLTVLFSHAEKLYVKGNQLKSLHIKIDGKELKKWTWSVEGNRLMIRHPKISPDRRVSVHFAQEGYCQVNLYNQVGLPAFPFEWEDA